MRPPRRLTLWAASLIGAALFAGLVLALLSAAEDVRASARRRFFEQYNRQQLLLAEQAGRNIEEFFDTLSRNLGMVGSLFEGRAVTGAEGARASPTLERFYGLMGDMPVIDLVLFDKKGDVAAIVPRDAYTQARNYAWRDYFRWARDTGNRGKTYLSPFLRLEGGQNRGDKALIVARGIYDAAGGFAGVAMYTVNFDRLVATHVKPVRTDEGGYAWLVDSRNEVVLVDPAGRLSGLGFAEAFGEKWPRLHDLLVKTRSGEPGMDWYDFEDPADRDRTVRKLVGFAPIRIENQLWTLGVCTPEPSVEALLSQTFRKTQVFSAAVLAAVVLAAVLLVGLLAAWNRALRSAVAERTGELAEANRRLTETFEELTSAHKSAVVGDMALSLAHEIRNPLSSMRMNLNMLRRAVGTREDAAENIAIMEEEIVRLNRLLGYILTFARPARIQAEPLELDEIARRVLRLLNERIEGSHIRVTLRFPPEPTVVVGDAGQLHQVVLNLVLNAVEAMQEMEPPRLLTVAIARREDRVVLEISDTGGGFARDERDKIFDPFFTGKSQGLGLGLSIVKNIVVRHGGAVAARPNTPYGAVFTVTLPAGGDGAGTGPGEP